MQNWACSKLVWAIQLAMSPTQITWAALRSVFPMAQQRHYHCQCMSKCEIMLGINYCVVNEHSYNCLWLWIFSSFYKDFKYVNETQVFQWFKLQGDADTAGSLRAAPLQQANSTSPLETGSAVPCPVLVSWGNEVIHLIQALAITWECRCQDN